MTTGMGARRPGKIILLWALFCLTSWTFAATNYEVGVGKWDITGPPVGVPLMGYADPTQVGQGIHTRLYSRAFIFADHTTHTRFIFVSIDACFASWAVKRQVIKQLKTPYGDLYTEKNVVISATHTHSGPGGYSQFVLYDIMILGYNPQVTGVLVHGIVQSIKKAHGSMRRATLSVANGQLLDSNINRSPSAYLKNPATERARYSHDVDKTMTVLKIVDEGGVGMGMISWFPVHCTSMNNTNHLLSSDNKGHASQLFEKHMNGRGLPDKGSFVAAFAQSNLGDVSPNTRGPRCLDSGDTCDTGTKTCNDQSSKCVSFGPGTDMFSSTEIIGHRQFTKALELYNEASILIEGPVDFRHSFVDMTRKQVTLNNGTQVRLCPPAMGYRFAAGTTDGPSHFDISQDNSNSNTLLNVAKIFIKTPSNKQSHCHSSKDILLRTGEMDKPYLWQPNIVAVQLARVGQLVIVAVPAEFSTMAGRRLRDVVDQTLIQKGFSAETITVIAGPANEYSSYVTTFEEYQVQRYEGASTIYGPHTLNGYLELYQQLASQMSEGRLSPPGPVPPNQQDKQISLLLGELWDSPTLLHGFGDVVLDANPVYTQGSTVTVKFVSANPNNDLTGSSFLTVERRVAGGAWEVYYTDGEWETRIQWRSTLAWREAQITWAIPAKESPGVYRIRHYGTAKSIFGRLSSFVGQTRQFEVIVSV